MAFVKAFVSLTLFSACSAFIFSRSTKWNDLKVTWGINPFSSTNFDSLPRTTQEARQGGFVNISDCDENANWRGVRYVKNNDRAVILLYDVNGYIAGIQASVPSDLSNGYPRRGLTPPFVEDGDNYVISAYFVDPSIICTTGRSDSDFQMDGTGKNLYIQNGTVAETDSILIPNNEEEIAATQWTEGKCFYSMGKHYWYNLSDDMDCQKFFPVFLLYNGGKLNAFGWAMMADLTSPRFEHPGQRAFGYFFKSVPRCTATAGTVTTMHIYLTHRVILNTC